MINIFKKRENNSIKEKNWSDITLKQYYLIRDTMMVQDQYLAFNLIDIIYGIDSQSLLLSEITPYLNTLEFLKEEPKICHLKREYVLNGRKYEVDYDLGSITTGQFIDWRNYLNQGDALDRLQNILSIFFVPKGHSYGDGYDISIVQEDILHLDYQTIYSAAFFFEKQLRLLLRTSLLSLKKEIKRTKMEKGEKKRIIKKIEEMDLPNMISYLISLSTVKLRTKSLQTH